MNCRLRSSSLPNCRAPRSANYHAMNCAGSSRKAPTSRDKQQELADDRCRPCRHRPHLDRQGLSRHAQCDRRRNAARPRQGRSERGRGRGDGRGPPAGHDRRQHRAQGAAPRRSSGDDRRHHHRPAMRLRPAGDRAGRTVGDLRRRRGSRSAAAASRSRWCRTNKINTFHVQDPALLKIKGEVDMPMIDTAEIVAKRYNISREKQDEYSLESQRRVAAAQQGGKFKDEMAPIKTTMAVADKATGQVSMKEVMLSLDQGPRPETTAEGLAGLKLVRGDGFTITAGNASQLSDGASASVIMSDKEAAK